MINQVVISFLEKKTDKANQVFYGDEVRRYLILFLLVFIISVPVCHATTVGEVKSRALKRVLILNSYHASYLWTKSIIEGIESVFHNANLNLLLSYEHMDTKHHQPDQIFKLLKDLYSRKYATIHFDIIIALDNNAFEFLLANRDILFPESVVVFCGIVGFDDSMLAGRPGFTGILEDYDIKSTIDIALAIHPETQNLGVISGVSRSSLLHQARFFTEVTSYKQRINVIDMCRLDPPQLKRQLKQLPPNTVLLYLGYYKTPDGTFLAVKESTSLVFELSGLPTYSLWEHTIGYGIVGGMMIYGQEQGQKAAEYAIQILKGADVASLPIIRRNQPVPTFDYGMMEHFNISKSQLPKNSLIKNEPQTIYYQYKYWILGIIAFIGYQSITILTLRWNLIRRKKAEKELRASEELHRITMENIVDPVFITDNNGNFTFICNSVSNILGYSMDELEEMHNISTFLGKNFIDLGQLEKQREIRNIEKIITDKFGRQHTYLITIKRVSIKEGTILYTFHDITDTKHAYESVRQLETQLFHSQKMEAIGTFAGGIAHDLNNILGAITTCSEMAIEDTPDNKPVCEDLKHILNAANRGKKLIQQILAFSRKKDRETQPIHLKITLLECLELIRHIMPSTVEIKTCMESENDIILANPTKIHQVIMNLCSNAEQAMRGQTGILSISLLPTEISANSSETVVNLPPGQYQLISVKDTGHGMDLSTIERIFEPFYTTRKHGEGTGLGLSVAHGIINGYGGTITVESAPGRGSTFNVYLPVMKKTVQNVQPPDIVNLPTGRERILLVEDDKDMLYSTKKMLDRLGYSVDGFAEGSKALEAFRSNPLGYDLVITDQIMPCMTGVQLCKAVLKNRVDIPVILCSGFLDDESHKGVSELLEESGAKAIIHKPFSNAEISQIIRRTIRNCNAVPQKGNP